MRRLVILTLLSAMSVCAFAASDPAVEAKNGMVVSSQHFASQIGVDILKAGGNAVDAAVAVGYAQAVTNSCCGNIGGGGFMTIHLADGRDRFINFRETAPAAASANMYLDASGNVIPDQSLYGYRAVGVPGTVAGLDLAQRKYGKLTRKQVMAPAIRLARDGFVLTRGDTDILDTTVERFRKDPEAARIFLRPDGTALQPGDRLVQKDLARTLERIAEQGPDAFYHGEIPKIVEAASKRGGGVITAADFASYRAQDMAPLTCTYRGYEFVSAPPPSSGGVTMCETLNILEGYDLRKLGYHSAAAVHYMTEAMRHAYEDRNTLLGDPDFIDNPIAKLTSKEYAAQIRKSIHADTATPSVDVQPGVGVHEKPETTHYSIVDHDGNAVSTTYTVNGRFGAVVIAPGTGFFLNDEMDDFTVKVGAQNLFGLVQGTRNSIAPGKRPLSSMAPTIVKKDGKVFMVVGSPGGLAHHHDHAADRAERDRLRDDAAGRGRRAAYPSPVAARRGLLRNLRPVARHARDPAQHGLQDGRADAVGRRRVDHGRPAGHRSGEPPEFRERFVRVRQRARGLHLRLQRPAPSGGRRDRLLTDRFMPNRCRRHSRRRECRCGGVSVGGHSPA